MNRTQMVVFSYDRPMQCDLMLKSFRDCVGDIMNVDINVLYRSSDEQYQKGYEICIEENKFANFIKQDLFYEDVKSLVSNNDYDYVLFCTDDTIFIRNFMIEEIESVLDVYQDVLNFSLRLGLNTYYCYSLSTMQKIPANVEIDGIVYWHWIEAQHDFGYPLELSSSVLRTTDIKRFVNAWTFTDPNIMEWYMDVSKWNLASRHTSACYQLSVAFSAPMNKVKKTNNNRSSQDNKYSKENLLGLYLDGYRVFSKKFYRYLPKGAHEEVEFEFIKPIKAP